METVVNEQVGGILDIDKLLMLEASLDNYCRYANQFEELVAQILSLADETAEGFAAAEKTLLDEVAGIFDTQAEYEGKIKAFHRFIVGAQVRGSLVSNADLNLNASFHSSTSTSIFPKLKKIQVPKFDGEFINFPNFKGMFDNLVHNNTELSSVQKLHYLKPVSYTHLTLPTIYSV